LAPHAWALCIGNHPHRLARRNEVSHVKNLAGQAVNKGKGVASSSHGNKRSRGTQEAPSEDASMPPQPPWHYGLRCVIEQHVTYVTTESVRLMFSLMTGRPVNIDVIIKGLLTRERVKSQRFRFGGLLTQFLREQQINEDLIDYRPWYDPKGPDLMRTKELKVIHGPVLSLNECNACIDNVLSH
ncbi:hypothetical protein HAX54_044722, partial [Datura stramonium]|nr:hypothetical protein [Datura stramonium]